MYRIFADDTLIYDGTLDDYKIGKGAISLEINKSGSFVFSLYPDHFFYNNFVRLKTVITVYKSGRIVFRGRILTDVTDYHNNKTITCEGELGFLQDSIIRPYEFSGTPGELLSNLIAAHNAQVDAFKQFRVGDIKMSDASAAITRSNADYSTALTNVIGQFPDSALGGYIYITHGENGDDPIPTINYCSDFSKVSTQIVEFGSNLKDYTKTVKADSIATAIIPLGAELSNESGKERLTIAKVNDGVDYVYSADGVALYGWIFKTVTFDDVVLADELKAKAEAYVKTILSQNVTIELTVIDLHLIDPTIEPFSVCDHVRAVSKPHNFDAALLCNKQTLDLLKPENDTLTLGYATTTLTREMSSSIRAIERNTKNVKTEIEVTTGEIRTLITEETTAVRKDLDDATVLLYDEIGANASEIETLSSEISQTAGSISAVVEAVGANGTVTAASIVAAINQSGSSVKIAADHVNISGFVTFDDLSSSGSTIISGDNISTGTISGITIEGTEIIGATIEGTEIIGSSIKTDGDEYDQIVISDNRITTATFEMYSNGSLGTFMSSYGQFWLAAEETMIIGGAPNTQIMVGSSGAYYWDFTEDGIYLCTRRGAVVGSVVLE